MESSVHLPAPTSLDILGERLDAHAAGLAELQALVPPTATDLAAALAEYAELVPASEAATLDAYERDFDGLTFRAAYVRNILYNTEDDVAAAEDSLADVGLVLVSTCSPDVLWPVVGPTVFGPRRRVSPDRTRRCLPAIVTSPAPYSPAGMRPSKPPYSRGWSSVCTARWLCLRSVGTPLGIAQLTSTPSCSSRKS